MRLVEARQAMNQQLDIIRDRRSQLQKLLKEQEITGNSNFDRVELSKELKALDEVYEETFQERERLNELGAAVFNAEASRQQAEVEAEVNEEMMKCLEIFRRIANGDKVPASDEQKLMKYDSKLYMAAKSMSVVHMGKEGKEYDSLWEEEEKKEESPDPSELANNTEVTLSMPELPETAVPEMAEG